MPGLMMGALAGAGGAMQEIGRARMISDLAEEKDIAAGERLDKRNILSEERGAKRAEALEVFRANLTAKTEAAKEARIEGKAQGYADARGGLMSQGATDAYTEFAKKDPQGAALGQQAVRDAEKSGAYKQETTIADLLRAKGEFGTLANIEQQGVTNDRTARKDESDEVHRGKELKIREDESKSRIAADRIRASAEGRLAAGAKIDNEIKTMALDNAKHVNSLQGEYKTATDARKQQIRQEVQFLTGKDNDSYLPIPIKDELGAITGYDIFDKKSGTIVSSKAVNAPPTPADIAATAKKYGITEQEVKNKLGIK